MAIEGIKFNGIYCIDGNGPGGQTTIHSQRMTEGTLSYERNTEDVEGHVDGNCVMQVLETLATSETYSLSMGTRDIDSSFLELIMDERWSSSTGYDMNYVNTAAIGATNTILDIEIAGTLAVEDVQVSLVTSNGTNLMRPLQVILTGTPTTEQVLVTPSTGPGVPGSLTFNAALAVDGAAAKYSISTPQTVETLGFEKNGITMTNMSFFAQLCMTSGERVYMKCRQMTKSGGFEFDLKGTGNATLEYKVTAKPGFRRPIEFIRRPLAA